MTTQPTEPAIAPLSPRADLARVGAPEPDPRIERAVRAALFGDRPFISARIGRFAVTREIGRGGMGVVYLAYDEVLDRRVGVKLLAVEREEDQPRLMREAQAMARVSHPNVASVYEVGEHADRLFIAMEFIQGVSLDVWLRAEHRDWRDVVDAFLQAGHGLAAAHSAGLIHRDFKPANAMLGDDGRVRVLDFGLARTLSPKTMPEMGPLGTRVLAPSETDVTVRQAPAGTAWAAFLTDTNGVVGTPAYMAPEQLAGQTVDARADQFSFCVSLYQGLYGQHPFAGDNVPRLWTSMLEGKVLAPPRDTTVPASLHRILLRGLSVDPGERFPAMGMLIKAIEQTSRRRRNFWGVGAVAVGVLASGLAVLLPAQPSECEDGAEALQGVWNEGQREALRATFARSGAIGWEPAWEVSEAFLEDYTGSWREAAIHTCAAHERGDESDLLFERRQACLRRRHQALGALRSLTDLDMPVLPMLQKAITSLPPMDVCNNNEALLRAISPPDDPLVAAEIVALEARLADFEVRRYAGPAESHRGEAAALAVDAGALGYAPAIAKAARLQGLVSAAAGDETSACQQLHESYALADAVGDDELAVYSAIGLILACKTDGVTPAGHVSLWHRLAEGKLDRAALRESMAHVTLLQTLAGEAQRRGASADSYNFGAQSLAILDLQKPTPTAVVVAVRARLAFDAVALADSSKEPADILRPALKLCTGELSHESAECLRARFVEASFLGERGDGANDRLEQVVAELARRDDPDSLSLRAQTLKNLAFSRLASCELDLATLHAKRALEISALAMDSESQMIRSLTLVALGTIQASSERVEEAWATLEPAFQDASHLQLDNLQFQLAVVSMALTISMSRRAFEPARAQLRRLRELTAAAGQSGSYNEEFIELFVNERYAEALRVMEGSVGPAQLKLAGNPGMLGNLLAGHAAVAFAAGDYGKARTSAERAIGLIEPQHRVSRIFLGAPLTILGSIDLAEGHQARARVHLERALALREQNGSDPQFCAENRFALARALSPDERPRALALAGQAVEEFRRAGDGFASERAKVEAWLGQHHPNRR